MTTKEFRNSRDVAENPAELMKKIDQYGMQASEIFSAILSNQLTGAGQVEAAYQLAGTTLSMATLCQLLVEQFTKQGLIQLNDKLRIANGGTVPTKDEGDGMKVNMAPVKE